MRFGGWGLKVGVYALGFKIQGLRASIQGLGVEVRFRADGFRFKGFG